MNEPTQQQRLIRPIPTAAIGRIVAGQAITDLASAVKELLDNAIDAGAKRVSGEGHCSS
jgi:DNA mismatch repair ATPase MutL